MTVNLKNASTPKAERVYAIGDVHGCLDELELLLKLISKDLAAKPVKRHTIIFLGDYIDRGPDSSGVISRLIKLQKTRANVICLKGNHEEKTIEFLQDPETCANSFFSYGGIETSRSYGVKAKLLENPIVNARKIRNLIMENMPWRHMVFLFDLQYSTSIGDYFFCHAGVRPGVRLRDQSKRDLMWIRSDFLDHSRPYKKVIVHGHTPQPKPEVMTNRINIDTRCYDSGVLTCLVLEGCKYRFLQTG